MQISANTASPDPDAHRRLQNAVHQFIALKNAQNQVSGEQAVQNATALLEALCQPRQSQLTAQDLAYGNTTDLAPQLALMRLKVQASV